MTLAELCHIYLQHTRGYKKSSHTDKSKISNYIVPQLGDTKIEDITRLKIQSYLNGLTNLKNSTKNRHLNLVKAIFSFAVEHCYMDKSPVAGMRTANLVTPGWCHFVAKLRTFYVCSRINMGRQV